jgi:hypothetical protein
MSKRLQFGAILLGMAMSASAGARTQKRETPPAKAVKPAPAAKPAPAPPQERRMLDLPTQWIDRVQQMTPAEQERFLANNERFHSLPPARQAQIRQQLQKWNSLTPEQRQALIERQQVWNNMPPDQQRYVRDTLLPQWQSMMPRRRQVILEKLHELRGLDDTQRAAKLSDESFVSGLNPQERKILEDLSNLRVTGPEPPGL